jgi:hypothetical protein
MYVGRPHAYLTCILDLSQRSGEMDLLVEGKRPLFKVLFLVRGKFTQVSVHEAVDIQYRVCRALADDVMSIEHDMPYAVHVFLLK